MHPTKNLRGFIKASDGKSNTQAILPSGYTGALLIYFQSLPLFAMGALSNILLSVLVVRTISTADVPRPRGVGPECQQFTLSMKILLG